MSPPPADTLLPPADSVLPPPAAADTGVVGWIIGPQVPMGASPWPFFNENEALKANSLWRVYGTAVDSYYDFAVNQYILAARGNTAALARARAAADAHYAWASPQGTSIAPRSQALGGLILRSLDGHPDYGPWITNIARIHFQTWIGARLGKSSLHYGVRDGSYALLHVALLAAAHPDSAVRTEMRGKAVIGGEYYRARQSEDGGWHWDDPDDGKVSSGNRSTSASRWKS